MTYEELDHLCRAKALRILGALSVDREHDTDLDGFQTLLMLGPDEPSFWSVFTSSAEFQEPKDPMDHWSKRVIGALADELAGKAFFPSDGPPYPPFFTWATRTQRCHSSPVNLLVHDRAGMMVSFRGALALREAVTLPEPPANPCLSCAETPCLSSCPVNALTPEGYDVAACKSHISSPEGRECMQGCKVRLACPVSQTFGRLPAQTEFHMRAFLGPDFT